ncbi:MAG: hypothetical protein KA735_02550 [Burkholderiaceae bacterium]|nr:hypothetical protein [Burkholderiaceae bacterium]
MHQQFSRGLRRPVMVALAVMTMALVGCAAEVVVKDGQTYYGNAKVHYAGTLEAIKLYDKNHQERLLVKGKDGRLLLGSEKTNNIGQIANDNMPFHDFSYMPVAGALAIVFMSLAGQQEKVDSPAPAYSDLLVRMPDSELRTLPIMNDMLKWHINHGCVEVGEPVMIVDGQRNAFVPVHGDARLQRRSDLLPSCASLRKKLGYPPAQTIWD